MKMSLGTYSEVSLLDAQKLRDEVRALVAEGVNTRVHRKQKRVASVPRRLNRLRREAGICLLKPGQSALLGASFGVITTAQCRGGEQCVATKHGALSLESRLEAFTKKSI